MNFKERILYFLSKRLDYPLYSPRNVTLTLNYACNQKCIMCGIRKLEFAKSHEIKVWEAKKIIDEMVRLRIPDLVITGGEPFLYNGIFDIIDYARSRNRKIIMITNGFYEENIVDKIGSSGVDHLQISLDGACEEVYDSIRGVEGSFKVVIRNIKKLVSGGKSVGSTVTITRQNFRDLRAIADLARDLGCSRLAIRPAHVNNADPQDKDFSGSRFWITPDEIAEFKIVIKELKLFNRDTGFLDFPPGLDSLVDYFKTGYLPAMGSCFLGFTRMIVSYDGKRSYGVWMCEDMAGDIRKDSLADIWRGRKARELRGKIRRCAKVCLFPEMHEPELRNIFSLGRAVFRGMLERINV